ncbi:MAG: phosphoglucosamine mutase [Planctomycetota bacterium]
MRARLFGTDGIRDRANCGVLRPEDVVRVGRALWVAIKRHGSPVLLASDTRISRFMIVGALQAGLTSTGLHVVDLGILPTPSLALLVPRLGGALGVMVSASHNPVEDNGIKVLGASGEKLPDELERLIEEALGSPDLPSPTGAGLGTVSLRSDAPRCYVELVTETFRARGVDLRGLRIALDCAHGATAVTAPHILRELGADVEVIGDEPDGTNINAGCGAVAPGVMARLVIDRCCHLGMALDGDGDRVILADENGRVVDGDQMLAILALDWLRHGRLPGRRVVATVMSNLGLELALREAGIELVRTPVGDRHVAEALRREGLNLGGENSGHIILPFGDRLIGDGTITGLEVACRAAESGSLAALADCMTTFPQEIVNVRVREKRPFDEIAGYRAAHDRAAALLGAEGRVLVRYSGTEPVLRVMVEGRDGALVKTVARELAEVLTRALS